MSEAAKELKSTEDMADKELAYLEHQGLVHRRGDGYIYPFAPRR